MSGRRGIGPLPTDPEQGVPLHPLGTRARVLLTSVFGPYSRDDEYGSRAINPMELYHNQVTRTQGPFSLRMFHRSWGTMLIQANIGAPCTLLDFPDLERFIREIRERPYDIIGITSIIPNTLKVKKMCELIRRYRPEATIVVGGHVANQPGLARTIDADHIVKGDGVRWFRRYLGEEADRPVRHPQVYSGFGARNVGVALRDKPGDVAATLIPSVGCPMGCNFCSTSAMFGGKGSFIDFYQSGDELFDVMCQLEGSMKVQSFFVMDENFLLHRKRALRLLQLMEEHDKAWALYVFSSAQVLLKYTLDQLVRLGISWVWMGLEGENSRYSKLENIDARALVRRMQENGIRVLGSSIIGLENHTPANIDKVIAYAVDYGTDFHQFMLYTPIPGTPFHAEMEANGALKDPSECQLADVHGQLKFNYRHEHIRNGEEGEFLVRAFDRDFEVNGPSIVRIVRTTLALWKRHGRHPDPRVRRRVAEECKNLPTAYSAVIGAAKLYYRGNPALLARVSAIHRDLVHEFGWRPRLFAALGGRFVLHRIRKEEKRLAGGWTYEPPTFFEKNEHCPESIDAELCRYVSPAVAPLRPVAVTLGPTPAGTWPAEVLAGAGSPSRSAPAAAK